MANNAVIAETGQALLTLLRNSCTPDPVRSAEQIGLCAQNDLAEFSLALILYDIAPMNRDFFPTDTLPLCLRYILTARSNAVPEIRAVEQARILDRAISAFAKQPVLPPLGINNRGVSIGIQMESLSLDEKTKVFDPPGGILPAAFYAVSPVLLDTGKQAAAPRVRSTG